MRKWSVYVYFSEVIEAEDQFEAEQEALRLIERDGVWAKEVDEEDEDE